MGVIAVVAGFVVLGIALYASGRDDGGGKDSARGPKRTACVTATRHATRSVPIQATVRAVDEAQGEATVTEEAEAPLPDGSGSARVKATVRATATQPVSSTNTVIRRLHRRGKGSARVCAGGGGRRLARKQAAAQALAGAEADAMRNLTRAVPGARRRVARLAREKAGAKARQKAADARPRADERARGEAQTAATDRARKRATIVAKEKDSQSGTAISP
jgi:hypothetical protein